MVISTQYKFHEILSLCLSLADAQLSGYHFFSQVETLLWIEQVLGH